MTILVGSVGLYSDTEGSISETLDVSSSATWESDILLTVSGYVSETGDASFIGEVIGNTLPPAGESFDPDVLLFADDGSLSLVVGIETTHNINDVLVHSWQFGGPENDPSDVVAADGIDPILAALIFVR